MARAFKACLINPDRTITVHYINKKLKLGPNAFRTNKKSDEVYIINPEYTITTTTKRMMMPFRYTTSYYKRNIPVAVDINQIHGGVSEGAIDSSVIESMDEEGVVTFKEKALSKANKDEFGKPLVKIINPVHIPHFEGWDYTGISAEELGTLFNPQFYKMIARANTNKKQEMMYMMQIGTLAGIGFILYYMIQNLPKAVAALVKAATGGH